jgi:hypothetical protein
MPEGRMGNQTQNCQPVFGTLHGCRRRKPFLPVYGPTRRETAQFPHLAGVGTPGEGGEVVSGSVPADDGAYLRFRRLDGEYLGLGPGSQEPAERLAALQKLLRAQASRRPSLLLMNGVCVQGDSHDRDACHQAVEQGDGMAKQAVLL